MNAQWAARVNSVRPINMQLQLGMCAAVFYAPKSIIATNLGGGIFQKE